MQKHHRETFVGREEELSKWSSLLNTPFAVGQAVVIVGKYGMGKTWLLDEMLNQAQQSPTLKCFPLRYVIAPGESPGMILRLILDDLFQAARHEAGTLAPEGKRFIQWTKLYREFGFFAKHQDPDFKLLDQLRFDNRKNMFEQFLLRLQLFSDLLPANSRLLFALDPELDTPATRVQLWTQVVQNLPAKIFFLFAQRWKDTLAVDNTFRELSNVHFIPQIDTQGLGDLSDADVAKLTDSYRLALDRSELTDVFQKYRNHPYAVHAALNLLQTKNVRSVEDLPQEPMPTAVCPAQWKAINEHPLKDDAVRILLSYAVLEVPSLDEMICLVADIPQTTLNNVLADPFLRSLIRDEADGRLIYHHHLTSFLRNQLYTADGKLTEEAKNLHRRAMIGYEELTRRSIKPDPLATVRLAEHSLTYGGVALFAETICQNAQAFFRLGFFQTFAAMIDRALALTEPDTPEALNLHYQLGELRHRQKDYQSAVHHYNISLTLAREQMLPESVAAALVGLAKAATEQELFSEADRFLLEAKNKYEATDNKVGLTDVLVLASEVLWSQRRYPEAESTLNQALRITQDVKNQRLRNKLQTSIYSAWGRMYDSMGQIERSSQQYYKALDLTCDVYDREHEADLRASISHIFERIGNLKQAEQELSKALLIHQDLKQIENCAEDNLRLSRVSELQGKPELAEEYLSQAKRMFRQIGNIARVTEIETGSSDAN